MTLEEALRPELVRVGIDVGPEVDDRDRGNQPGVGRDGSTADLGIRGELPHHVDHDRPQPERLLHHGVEVFGRVVVAVKVDELHRDSLLSMRCGSMPPRRL